MKRFLLFCTALLSLTHARAQVFWTEDFGAGCNQGFLADTYASTNGSWFSNDVGPNNPMANVWFTSAIAHNTGSGNCAEACGDNPSLHVSHPMNLGIDPDSYFGYQYTFCGTPFCDFTNRRIESPLIDCSGKTGVTLSFLYIEGGDAFDNASLWFFDGTDWTQLEDLAKTAACGTYSGIWTAHTVSLPAAADNNPNVKFGFLWTNNGDFTRTDPSFAVDDIAISASSAACFVSAQTSSEILCNGVCSGVAFAEPTGTAPFAYLWSNGSTEYTASDLCSGTYGVTMTDALGCSAASSAALTEPVPFVANALVTHGATCSQCEDGQALAIVEGGTGPYSFIWGNGETTNPATGFNPGTYDVLIVDANGCAETDTITVLDLATSVATQALPLQLLFPNPVHNRLYVEGLTGDAVVFNAVGKLCMTIPVSVQNEIDVSSLPVGLYFIRANRPRSKSVVYRFVKL